MSHVPDMAVEQLGAVNLDVHLMIMERLQSPYTLYDYLQAYPCLAGCLQSSHFEIKTVRDGNIIHVLDAAIVQLLLGRPEINGSPTDWNGNTPLSLAEDEGHDDVVLLLEEWLAAHNWT
ncbi:hypothetical protein BDV25DRAFT_140327 [Aspergillus avenaceus]|uniref:Ankyrin repeat-containing domain protein n=1 Tax=Aspergillus avenaceus TaxID=36643 RepID=A0A5N6TUA3_ASPAV|nr:hypothetical protein BDV25DRAFT_140327 [Aspergillus avenaceus]